MQATATRRKLRPNAYRKVLDSRKRRVREPVDRRDEDLDELLKNHVAAINKDLATTRERPRLCSVAPFPPVNF